MNKYKFLCFFFFLIFGFIFLIFLFSSKGERIDEVGNDLEYQNSIISYYNSYLYTIDNPKVVVDPFNKNYNTALIMFETNDYVSIDIYVNDNSFTTDKTNRHFIVLYDLVVGDNVVNLKYNGKMYSINVLVDEGKSDINFDLAYVLNNNHFIVPISRYLNDFLYIGFMEIDITGKIYYEYILECGYDNIITEYDEDKYAIYVSNSIVIIDRQNGNIIKKIDVLSDYDFYAIDYVGEFFVLYSDKGNISVDDDGVILEVDYSYEKEKFSGNANYINSIGVRFSDRMISERSKKSIWLLNYKKLDKDIKIEKEFNRVIVSGEDVENASYVVFDKLFDKRVYALNDDINYVYTDDFNGSYSVYYVIDDIVYKSNKYIEF